jgi:DnaJ family protein A protein 2
MISSELISLARSHFGVELPTSSVELKKAYRRACIRLHPDVGGDEIEFKEMQKAYDRITDMGSIYAVFSEEKEYATDEQKTANGVLLKDLGLGLGPNVNGKDCPTCGHKGYIENNDPPDHYPCTRCYGTGLVYRHHPVCRACKGTGKFKQARSGRVVECRVCKGSGVWNPRNEASTKRGWYVCEACCGAGFAREKHRKAYYSVCYTCSGTGEIPCWNPVLLKGALTQAAIT